MQRKTPPRTQRPTVLITRPRKRCEDFCAILEQADIPVFAAPVLDILPLLSSADWHTYARSIEQYDGYLITSAESVRSFLKPLLQHIEDSGQYHTTSVKRLLSERLCCVGQETARACETLGLQPALLPTTTQDANGLLAALAQQGPQHGKRYLFAASSAARDTLPTGLTALGAAVEHLAVYSIEPVALPPDLRALLLSGDIARVALNSPSQLDALLADLGVESTTLPPDLRFAAIGPTTAAALSARGISPWLVSPQPSMRAYGEAIRDAILRPNPIGQKTKEPQAMSISFKQSQAWMERARHIMPGGVNSPVRAFRAVGGTPPMIRRAQGAYLWDEDGNRYIDYVGSWGPMILGHAHPEVVAAIQAAAVDGTSYGAPTVREVLMAEKIRDFFPSMEMVRLVSSGTEATMSAIRLARAATKRDRLIKFSGCYHGHGDSFLIAAGSGATTFGVPNSPGVTTGTAADTLLAEYNDLAGIERLFSEYPDSIAAIIIEPVPGNMGLIKPEPGFLEGLREITTRHGALLIFDEVMTGFRVTPGGVTELFGIKPDLITLGKIIGGGLPVGAYGGRADLMQQVAPVGPVYQAGTLSGNPLATAAGLATLEQLTPAMYASLEDTCKQLEEGLRAGLSTFGRDLYLTRYGSMLCLFFSEKPVRNYTEARTCDTAAFARYFHAMLQRGVYLPAAQFEAFFVSAAHTHDDIQHTLQAHQESLAIAFSA